MTADDTNNERPKLPPGRSFGDTGYLRRNWKPPAYYGNDDWAAHAAWEEFEEATGISREKWERMVRDHEAMEALRRLIPEGGSCRMSFSTRYPDGSSHTFSGHWSADDPAEACQAMTNRIRKAIDR